mmetsp:Transcript_75668/g.214103  ORF Transcript_75668/g.214103 Transcript_75668/m.214103 type:complete len:304 (-) Transcript_75668:119-1030(-)
MRIAANSTVALLPSSALHVPVDGVLAKARPSTDKFPHDSCDLIDALHLLLKVVRLQEVAQLRIIGVRSCLVKPEERLVDLHLHGERAPHGLQGAGPRRRFGGSDRHWRVVAAAEVDVLDELRRVLALLLALLHGPGLETRQRHVRPVEEGAHGEVGVRGLELHLHLLIQQRLRGLRKVLAELHALWAAAALVLLGLGLVDVDRHILLALDLAVRADPDVGLGLGHARKAEAGSHLVIVEEGLRKLVHGALEDLAGATGAGARAAGVGQHEALLLRPVQDEDVVGALETPGPLGGLQRHGVVRR